MEVLNLSFNRSILKSLNSRALHWLGFARSSYENRKIASYYQQI